MNLLKTISLCTLCLSLIACGGDKQNVKAEKEPTSEVVENKVTTPEVPRIEGAILTVAAARLFPPSAPEKAIVIAEDGTVSVEGKPVGMLINDGRMTNIDGTVISVLGTDGTVTTPDGKTLPMMIMPDGSMVNPEKTMRVFFDEAGMLQGGIEGSPAIQSDGCDKTTARSCMYVLLMMMTPKEPAKPAAPSPVAPMKK